MTRPAPTPRRSWLKRIIIALIARLNRYKKPSTPPPHISWRTPDVRLHDDELDALAYSHDAILAELRASQARAREVHHGPLIYQGEISVMLDGVRVPVFARDALLVLDDPRKASMSDEEAARIRANLTSRTRAQGGK